jgi:DNA-binding transcriptional regulator GbsR (MarR family)
LTSVKDADHSGHPLTSKTDENVDKVKDLVLENRRITIHEVANILGISVGSVHTSLKDSLNMHNIAMKFVSWTCSLCFFCM